jgi:molybdopterin molybdotransferase
MQFFRLKPAAEVHSLLDRPTPSLATEQASLERADGRILAAEVRSPIALPEFPRAAVDGFAVRAEDTFGASPGSPAYLQLAGEVLMGQSPSAPVAAGTTQRIATGGMLPGAADAVVMVEYADVLDGGLVEIFRAAAPGDGMVAAGDDLQAGTAILPRGRRLRPQDIGALAAVGITDVEVFARPRVAVIPSGDELVKAGQPAGPGQVRDVNTPALCAAVRAAGAEPVPFPIVRDDPESLRTAVIDALEGCDLVLVAGGSSVGTRDWTLDVFQSFVGAELLVHGVSIRPGKPVIIVAVEERLLIGLPGNPVSALVVFDRFVRPYLGRLSGEERVLPAGSRVRARLTRSYSSDAGKEDYVRARVTPASDGYDATPLLGKSTLLMTLVEADGLIVVPAGIEGLEAGTEVEVELF